MTDTEPIIESPQVQIQNQNTIPTIGEAPRVKFTSKLAVGHVPPYRAVFLISNAALGAGLLNFPQAYMNAGGTGVAIVLQLILMFPIVGAFMILAYCADKSGAPTYQDVILYMLGERWRNFAQILIGIYFFGSALTYLIIIGDQLHSVIDVLTGVHAWYTDQRFLAIVFAVCILLPLVIPRRLKALSYTSFFGGVGAFFITGVIVYEYYKGGYTPKPTIPRTWRNAFSAIPVICFGFQCHVSSVAVYAELRNRSRTKFFCCACVAMLVCAVTYCLSGHFGYHTFGEDTLSDILENYREKDALVNVTRVSIVLILLSSFAIVSFCARTVIDGIYLQLFPMSEEESERTERRRRVIITVAWFALALLISALVPNIGVAIALIGGIASTFIFVFPGLMLFRTVDLEKPELTGTDKLVIFLSGLYMFLGMFIFGEVTTLAIGQDITGKALF